MPQSKQLLSGVALAAVLLFVGTSAEAAEPFSRSGFMIAAEDAPPANAGDTQADKNGSAKMGKDEGTHTGADQGVTPENDTDKIDQPARKDTPSDDTPAK